MPQRLFITGLGLVTPLGHSAWSTFAALLAGRSIADRVAELPADISSIDLVRAIGGVSFAQHSPCDPSVELAERAAREALEMAGIAPAQFHELPCIIATSKGAVHALTAAADRHQPRAQSTTSHPPSTTTRAADAHLAVTLGPHGYLTHHLRRRLHLGDTTHLVAACASSLIALHRARLALMHDENSTRDSYDHRNSSPTPDHRNPRRILIVTADSALLPSFIHAYHRLGVLAPFTCATYRGLPLDERANGFMIAQAGAAIVLERIDHPNAQLPRHAVELIDTGEACDAFDLIRPSDEMPALRRLAASLIGQRTIDLIHPHATGTDRHDAIELTHLLSQLPQSQSPTNGHSPSNLPDLYAHKGALGHTLGCSGLVSIVLACLCARTQRRPPMPWLDHPISPNLKRDGPGTPGTPIRTQAIFAAGFAGHAAGAVLGTPS